MCKIFGLEIRRCNFFDKSHVCRVLLSSRCTVAGRETRLEVGKEALTMIVTFLYSRHVHLEGVEVELLFEVLEIARMMRITDLEKELEDFIVGDLLAQSNSDQDGVHGAQRRGRPSTRSLTLQELALPSARTCLSRVPWSCPMASAGTWRRGSGLSFTYSLPSPLLLF